MRLANKYIIAASSALCSMMIMGSCSSGTSDGNDSAESELSGQSDTFVSDKGLASSDAEVFHASNDIAMRVRSVAAALNEGEAIDSTDYNFSGVLTDGMGAPIFTDFEGLPGQWEVDVVNSKEVKIRNIGTGDLMPGSLMEYVTSSINSVAEQDETPELQMVGHYEEGDASIEKYTYGHTTVQVETRPQTLPTGEVGPKLEITLRYDTIPG
ncbi:MAG: hypothetical protein NC217_07165 [Muribaculaceae bacterium]|nr:hypothetical protein [Muribaculaceae bacterium]